MTPSAQEPFSDSRDSSISVEFDRTGGADYSNPDDNPGDAGTPTLPHHTAAPADDWALDAIYSCERCRTHLRRDRLAHFCPHCGLALLPPPLPAIPLGPTEAEVEEALGLTQTPPLSEPDRLGEQLSPQTATPSPAAPAASLPWSRDDILLMIAEWQRILDVHLVAGPAAVPPQPNQPVPAVDTVPASRIISGYANALFRLGAYYENSLSSRNSNEAIRCYLKSARLGNLEALSRLAPKCSG